MTEESIRLEFDTLYRAEYARVFRSAYLIVGNGEEARDLTQEAFARAYANWSRVSSLTPPGPAAWLQRVAGNLSISWRRRQRVRIRGYPVRDRTSYELEEVDPSLARALKRLSSAERAVIVLRYYADQSVDQVATALGKRPGTVRSLTARGVAKLRQVLQQEEVRP